MKKSYGKINGILAIFLAGAILLNNGGVYSVFAAENNMGENTASVSEGQGNLSSGESAGSSIGTESGTSADGSSVEEG